MGSKNDSTLNRTCRPRSDFPLDTAHWGKTNVRERSGPRWPLGRLVCNPCTVAARTWLVVLCLALTKCALRVAFRCFLNLRSHVFSESRCSFGAVFIFWVSCDSLKSCSGLNIEFSSSYDLYAVVHMLEKHVHMVRVSCKGTSSAFEHISHFAISWRKRS